MKILHFPIFCRPQVEYDLEDSKEDDFKLVATDRIEQSAVPTCFAWYPPIIKEDFLLVVNDQVSSFSVHFLCN